MVIATESLPRPPLDDAAFAGRLKIEPPDGLLGEVIAVDRRRGPAPIGVGSRT